MNEVGKVVFLMKNLIDKLSKDETLKIEELATLINGLKEDSDIKYLFDKARETSKKHFGNKIFSRGLIEFTNYCKNNCYYCGIRRYNKNINRYRLEKEDILKCCKQGYALGFRTFVLQGGEDAFYSDDKLIDIISDIRKNYVDCAITLSIGEKDYEQYEKYFKAGANRYLLRHETANSEHYKKLHPKSLSLENRKECLYNLKKIGYQVGTGFMVGSPYQTVNDIVEDLYFIKELGAHMIGIGPFIPHRDTPFGEETAGNLNLTLILISIIRLMNHIALIPATTALGTIDNRGREKGILAGANVVMPNLSPVAVRKDYSLYDNKICTGEEAAECRVCLQNRMKSIGYEIVVDRGDHPRWD